MKWEEERDQSAFGEDEEEEKSTHLKDGEQSSLKVGVRVSDHPERAERMMRGVGKGMVLSLSERERERERKDDGGQTHNPLKIADPMWSPIFEDMYSVSLQSWEVRIGSEESETGKVPERKSME